MQKITLFLLCLMLVSCHPARKTTATSNPHPAKPPAAQPQPQPAEVPVIATVQNVAWLDSERLMPVLEMAQKQHKAVFVELYASWCAPCKVMEEDIFTQPEVSQYLNSNFLNFHSDFDSAAGRTIAEIYDVEKLPTVLFLDPKGVVLERYLGFTNPSTLTQLGNSALQKMGN